jgi:hypothetical protein
MNVRFPAILLAIPICFAQAQSFEAACSRRTAEDYVPITRTERAADYVRSLTGLNAFLYSAALAGIDQARDHPHEWGQGHLGYERRFGNDFATHIIGTSLQHGFALGLGEDNRYFDSSYHNVGARLGYALTSPFLARHSNGSRSISKSALAGVAGAALIQMIWQPRSTSNFGNFGRSIALTFAFRAGLDAAREFAPRTFGGFLQ